MAREVRDYGNVDVAIYCSDFGTLRLSPRQVRETRSLAIRAQEFQWELHGDDLVGVPEVEVWNSAVTAKLDAIVFSKFSRISVM